MPQDDRKEGRLLSAKSQRSATELKCAEDFKEIPASASDGRPVVMVAKSSLDDGPSEAETANVLTEHVAFSVAVRGASPKAGDPAVAAASEDDVLLNNSSSPTKRPKVGKGESSHVIPARLHC